MCVNKYRRSRQQRGGGGPSATGSRQSIRDAGQRTGGQPSPTPPCQAAAGSFGWMGEELNGCEQLLLFVKKK